jgi:Hg(II)-responsive transcriptional regulator
MAGMTRGELSKKCGVNIETLRYYEKRQLIDPHRSEGGYRIYSEEDAVKIRFIRSARNLGFSLEEVSDLMKMRVDKKKSCDPVMAKAKNRLEEVEKKIKDLKSMRKVLNQMIDKCEESVSTNDCPILCSFESGRKV